MILIIANVFICVGAGLTGFSRRVDTQDVIP